MGGLDIDRTKMFNDRTFSNMRTLAFFLGKKENCILLSVYYIQEILMTSHGFC